MARASGHNRRVHLCPWGDERWWLCHHRHGDISGRSEVNRRPVRHPTRPMVLRTAVRTFCSPSSAKNRYRWQYCWHRAFPATILARGQPCRWFPRSVPISPATIPARGEPSRHAPCNEQHLAIRMTRVICAQFVVHWRATAQLQLASGPEQHRRLKDIRAAVSSRQGQPQASFPAHRRLHRSRYVKHRKQLSCKSHLGLAPTISFPSVDSSSSQWSMQRKYSACWSVILVVGGFNWLRAS
jgi:hypothetical protein